MSNQSHLNGVEACRAGRYQEAVDFFLQAIDDSPELLISHFWLGKSYFLCDKYQQAIESLNQYIALNQITVSVVDDASIQCAVLTDAPELAHEDLPVATDIDIAIAQPIDDGSTDANISNAHDLLGSCHKKMGNGDDALDCYQKALEINYENASAWHNRGLLYMESAPYYLEHDFNNSVRMLKTAMSSLKSALVLCNDSPMILHSVASWYGVYIEIIKPIASFQGKINHNFQKGAYFYQKALNACGENDKVLKEQIISNFAEFWAGYGHYFYKMGNYTEAQQLYEKAIALNPAHIAATSQIGMIFSKKYQFSKARQYFETILKILTNDSDSEPRPQDWADAWLNIACTYRLQRCWTDAENALQKAIQFAPGDEDILEERQKLIKSRALSGLSDAYQTIFHHKKSAISAEPSAEEQALASPKLN